MNHDCEFETFFQQQPKNIQSKNPLRGNTGASAPDWIRISLCSTGDSGLLPAPVWMWISLCSTGARGLLPQHDLGGLLGCETCSSLPAVSVNPFCFGSSFLVTSAPCDGSRPPASKVGCSSCQSSQALLFSDASLSTSFVSTGAANTGWDTEPVLARSSSVAFSRCLCKYLTWT